MLSPAQVQFDHERASDFARLQAPFQEAGLDLLVERARVRMADGELELDLAADVIDLRRDGTRVAVFDRVIRKRAAWHRSSLTYEPFQRRGIARRLLAASVALYDSLGLFQVHLNAVGVGRYVWARAGFDFEERVLGSQAEPTALAPLRALAARLGHDLGDAASAWEIAGRREHVPPGLFEARGGSMKFLGSPTDCEGPLGRVLFLCAGVGDWNGVLDLTPASPGRSQFERYCLPVRE